MKSMLSPINIEILPVSHQNCINQAIAYLEWAYAPYSNFRVAASILSSDGSTYGGANQENASYPLCMCAERVALYHYAMTHAIIDIEAIAITAQSATKTIVSPAMPCGACRQVLLEYEDRNGKPFTIYLINDNHDVFMVNTAKELLPYSFDASLL